MKAPSENTAKEAFNQLKVAMGADAQRAVARLEKDLDSLLMHYRFEKPFWRALKTTNPIERVTRELKRGTKVKHNQIESTMDLLAH